MDRPGAKRRIEALLKMTVANGCTPHEAATARRLAESLAAKYHFTIRARGGSGTGGGSNDFGDARERRSDRTSNTVYRCGECGMEFENSGAAMKHQASCRNYSNRYESAEAKAKRKFGWEFRSCGKKNCACMRTGVKHGPYKYGKKRTGKTVKSVYMGR